MASNSASQINVQPPQIITTQPDHILRHSISDEELDMLCEVRSDFVKEFLWIGIGGIIGAAPSALATMNNYFGNRSAADLSFR